nr:MAG TPA: hypothetical protein [Caudoviricetes sp.]
MARNTYHRYDLTRCQIILTGNPPTQGTTQE